MACFYHNKHTTQKFSSLLEANIHKAEVDKNQYIDKGNKPAYYDGRICKTLEV